MAILLSVAFNMSAQEQYNKPVAYLGTFNFPNGTDDFAKSALRNSVMEGLRETGRFDLRDALSADDLADEDERRKMQSAMEDVTKRADIMKTLAANYIITGDVTEINAERKSDSKGNTYYSGSVKWTIKVVDTSNGTVKASKTFSHPGAFLANVEETRDKAIVSTCEMAKKSMRNFVDDYFPIEGLLLKVETTDSKGKKAETVWIDLGSVHGISKGQKFVVCIEADMAGEIGHEEIGELSAREVKSGKRTVCKVNKGNKEIMKAMNEGHKLVVVTKRSGGSGVMDALNPFK